MKAKIKTGRENGSRAKLTSLTCDQAIILPRKKKEKKRTDVRPTHPLKRSAEKLPT